MTANPLYSHYHKVLRLNILVGAWERFQQVMITAKENKMAVRKLEYRKSHRSKVLADNSELV